MIQHPSATTLSLLALVAAIAAPAGAGNIAGTVKLAGKAPKPKTIKVTGQPYCVPFHKNGLASEMVVVSAAGGLRNVIVYVKNAPAGAAARAEAVTLDQEGCQYKPHVLALQVGQPLKVNNGDETLHNINGSPKANKKFNFGQPKKGMSKEVLFAKAEAAPIPVKCDVHGWMQSYIGVFAHPFFAITGADGSFKIENVPPGDYEVEAWHEKFKVVSGKVKVAATGDAKLNLSFAAKG